MYLYRHDAWHKIFYNLTPFEAVVCVATCLSPNDYFKRVVLTARLFEAEYRYDLKNPRGDKLKTIDYHFKENRVGEGLSVLFLGKNWVEIVSEIVTYWSPQGYFKKALAIGGDELQTTTFAFIEGRGYTRSA